MKSYPGAIEKVSQIFFYAHPGSFIRHLSSNSYLMINLKKNFGEFRHDILIQMILRIKLMVNFITFSIKLKQKNDF